MKSLQVSSPAASANALIKDLFHGDALGKAHDEIWPPVLEPIGYYSGNSAMIQPSKDTDLVLQPSGCVGAISRPLRRPSFLGVLGYLKDRGEVPLYLGVAPRNTIRTDPPLSSPTPPTPNKVGL